MSSLGLDLFAALGGNELWNQARVMAYMDAGIQPSRWKGAACVPCPTLSQIVPCEQPPPGGYLTPMDDPAPWYDEDRPESAYFGGLFVTDVTLSAAPARTVVENVGHGSTVGRLRLNGRTITVQGLLIGRTCCAVAYGLRWLTAALMGSGGCATGTDCGVDQLDTVSCCPCDDEPDLSYEPYMRTLHGVGLSQGPDILERHSFGGGGCGGSTCGCSEVMKVEFVLVSASPWFYTRRTPVLVGATPAACPDYPTCEVNWILTDGPCPSECPGQDVDFLSDPTCADMAIPPSLPLADNPCVCVPMRQRRLGVNVDGAGPWFDATATVEVKSQASEIRNLVVRMWPNPQGVDWDDEDFFPDCAACASLYVTYLPPHSVLTVDGERRQVLVRNGNVVRDASGLIYTQTGEPFGWLDMSCSDYVIAVDFDCDFSDVGATADVFVSGREV